MPDTELSQAVERLAQVGAGLPDAALERPWRWRAHEEGVRFAYLVTYQELRELAVAVAAERAARGALPTEAQRVLAQHHAAYRDLHGALASARDDILDRAPAAGEWPLRDALAHIVDTEHGFFAQISHAVERRRGGHPPERMPREKILHYHPAIDFDGTLAQLLANYEALHDTILHDLAPLGEDDLAAPSLWWEGYPVEARFRMHRFDAHLRQHTIQVEKTLAGVGSPPSEAHRLTRLLYDALGEAEGAAIGAWETGADRQRALAATIAARAGEVAAAV